MKWQWLRFDDLGLQGLYDALQLVFSLARYLAPLGPQAVASVLGVQEEPGRPLEDTLRRHVATAVALSPPDPEPRRRIVVTTRGRAGRSPRRSPRRAMPPARPARPRTPSGCRS